MGEAVERARLAQVCVVLSLFVGYAAFAERASGQQSSTATISQFQVDNDYFDFWLAPAVRPDDNYTQGARLSVLSPDPLPFVARFGAFAKGRSSDSSRSTRGCRHARADDPCWASELALTQQMYTPTIDTKEPQRGERPYLGWLGAEVVAHRFSANDHSRLSLAVGVTGPPSLAATAQEDFHRLVPRFRTPLGWDHQIATMLTGGLAYDREHVSEHVGGPRGMSLDVVPFAGASAGNLLVDARAGARALLGYNVDRAWLSPIAVRNSRFSVSGSFECKFDYVAHDLSLDAHTLDGRPQVSRIALVREYAIGTSIRILALMIEYRAVTQGRGYRTGPSSHAYGSITLGWRHEL